MADTFVQLNADGSGKKLDTRTEGTNSEHRQVVVIGDPTSNAGVAPVDATNGLAVQVLLALPAGANNIGQVSAAPIAAGTSQQHKLIAAATTNATNVKATPGQIYGMQLANLSASVRYLKLFNKATAPTVGTDVPVKTIPIQPNNTTTPHSAVGIYFSTGISYAITGGVADNDNTAVAAGDVVVNLDWI